MIEVGCEGVIAHDVTLGASSTNKILEFIKAKVIPSLHRQKFSLMDNVPFHRSREIHQALKTLDTSTFVCHHIVHFSMLQNGYLDTSKTMSNGMIYKIIEHLRSQ